MILYFVGASVTWSLNSIFFYMNIFKGEIIIFFYMNWCYEYLSSFIYAFFTRNLLKDTSVYEMWILNYDFIFCRRKCYLETQLKRLLQNSHIQKKLEYLFSFLYTFFRSSILKDTNIYKMWTINYNLNFAGGSVIWNLNLIDTFWKSITKKGC